MSTDYDAIVIGAGFYGLRIALFLREELGAERVLVLERDAAAMTRASYVNQARVHNGYHYPRSILTGYRSRVNFPDFVAEFGDAVVDRFDHYYAIANRLSKVNATQFELFCARIGAECRPAEPAVAQQFNASQVEAVFRVREPAFDSRILRDVLLERVQLAGGIEISFEDEADTIRREGDGLVVESTAGRRSAGRVISAVYSGLNALHARSGLPTVGLQHELTEMALVRTPPRLDGAAITVMDGPFFSMMPFPSRGLHTLSHVRYTPHHRWREPAGSWAADSYAMLERTRMTSRFAVMRADVARFLVDGADIEQVDSIWEVKTVLTKSDADDSRPILYRADHGIAGYTCIMGGKLDNIYDVLQELALERREG